MNASQIFASVLLAVFIAGMVALIVMTIRTDGAERRAEADAEQRYEQAEREFLAALTREGK